jgi:hypothetical protein
MRRYLAILALAALTACGGDKETTPTGDDDDDTTTGCSNLLLGQFPEDGDADVYYRTDVRFTLTTEDQGASITVADDGGTEVPGTTSVIGTLVNWTADEPLDPVTSYTSTISWECGEASVSWTTSEVGSPTEVDLTGKTYALDLTSGEFVEPPGVGDLLASQLGDVEILVGVESVDAGTVQMLGAEGDGAGNQNLCSPTIPFPGANYDDPYFSLISPLLPLDIQGFQIDVENLTLTGAFAPDGSRIQGTVLKGDIDTRPLVELVSPGGGDDAVCVLVGTFGVSCLECSDNSGPYCLSLWVDNIAADEVPGTTLVNRIQDDIDADPTCQ